MSYNIIDLFCGTGSFAQGFVNYSNKFKVVFAIDIEKSAVLTTKANHKDCYVVQDDIRNFSPERVKKELSVEKIDIIIGGPPCQGFSSLRPYRSSKDEDPRNNLFEQFALYVDFFKPSYFILENVVGILTHNKGKTLKRLQECFRNMDYDTDWRVLNAANFGVPQKRERFILIGIKKGGRIEFPMPTHHFDGRIIGYRDKSRMLSSDSHLPKAISVMDAIGDLPPIKSGEQCDQYLIKPQNKYQGDRRKSSKQLSLHAATAHSEKMLEIIKYSGDSIDSIPKHLISSGFSTCYSRLNPNEPANTITVKFTSPASSRCIHPYQDRSITPREAARLQSFDDDFIFVGSKTEIAEMIGNAVPSLLGRAIAEPIFKSLEKSLNLSSNSEVELSLNEFRELEKVVYK